MPIPGMGETGLLYSVIAMPKNDHLPTPAHERLDNFLRLYCFWVIEQRLNVEVRKQRHLHRIQRKRDQLVLCPVCVCVRACVGVSRRSVCSCQHVLNGMNVPTAQFCNHIILEGSCQCSLIDP